MPGGYSGYLNSLRRVCDAISRLQPSHTDLAQWMQEQFDLTHKSARSRESFLRKAGITQSVGGRVQITAEADRWYTAGNDGVLIALLHSRVQFIGEMLAQLLDTPKSPGELQKLAESYGLFWENRAQIRLRRGWLESARLIEPDDQGRLRLTDSGRDLASRLELHLPTKADQSPGPDEPLAPTPNGTDRNDPRQVTHPAISFAASVAEEVRAASTDSNHPDRLELAVRDAFRFLGFVADRLGGSGVTDVLVRAPLSKSDSYVVAVDAKSVGSGSLRDHQVDWVTLKDHRVQHNATYSLLVAPNPKGTRLVERAAEYQVALLAADKLADLCLQHGEAPLDLKEYEPLFRDGGEVDTNQIDVAARNSVRLRQLAAALCTKLAEQADTVGRLTARDLWLLMSGSDLGRTSSEQEIQWVLDALASPIVGAVQGSNPASGYVLASHPRVCQMRLLLLGRELNAEGN